MNDEALVTLDKIASLPDAPPRVLYEQGVILYRKADYARAWEKISAYIARRPVPSGDK
jgi:outer membrane protein assembly factor BamD (BamD/ComL family)